MDDVSLSLTKFIFNPNADGGEAYLELRGRAEGAGAALLRFTGLHRQSYLLIDEDAVHLRLVGLGGLRDAVYPRDAVLAVESGVHRPMRWGWTGLLATLAGAGLGALGLTGGPGAPAQLIGGGVALALGLGMMGYAARAARPYLAVLLRDDHGSARLRFRVPPGEAHHITRETLLQVISFINLATDGARFMPHQFAEHARLVPIHVEVEADDELILRVPSSRERSAYDDDFAPFDRFDQDDDDDHLSSPLLAADEAAPADDVLATVHDHVEAFSASPAHNVEDDDALERQRLTLPAVDDAEDGLGISTTEVLPVVVAPPFVAPPEPEPALRPNPKEIAEGIAEAVSRGTGLLPPLPNEPTDNTRPVPSPAIKTVTGRLRSAKDFFVEGRALYDEAEKLAAAGLIEESRAKYRAAIAVLTKAIEFDPEYYKSFGGRAKCYEALGEQAKADEDWLLYRTLARTQGGTMSLRPGP